MTRSLIDWCGDRLRLLDLRLDCLSRLGFRIDLRLLSQGGFSLRLGQLFGLLLHLLLRLGLINFLLYFLIEESLPMLRGLFVKAFVLTLANRYLTTLWLTGDLTHLLGFGSSLVFL